MRESARRDACRSSDSVVELEALSRRHADEVQQIQAKHGERLDALLNEMKLKLAQSDGEKFSLVERVMCLEEELSTVQKKLTEQMSALTGSRLFTRLLLSTVFHNGCAT